MEDRGGEHGRVAGDKVMVYAERRGPSRRGKEAHDRGEDQRGDDAGEDARGRSGASDLAAGEPVENRPTGRLAWDEKVETLPARQIEGVAAEGTRTTRTIPAGAIGNERPIVMVTEEWRSPDLQVLVATTTVGSADGRIDLQAGEHFAGSRVRGFDVPAGYTVSDTDIRKNMMIKRDDK